VPRGLDEAAVSSLALRDETVRKFVDGNPVKKTIYVPDRLVNLVT
jgi:leucyl-tRNA synthetase